MPFFICPNCGNRTTAQDRQQGFRNVPKGCQKCGFGFLFELLDDYYPAPNAAFFVCPSMSAVLIDAISRRLSSTVSRFQFTAELLAFFKRLSPDSLYFRFFSVPRLDVKKAESVSRVDYENTFALVLWDREHHLARDRGDKRHHHDRQDHPRGQHSDSVHRPGKKAGPAQALGEDGIVGRVDHHVEAVGDELLGGPEERQQLRAV